MPLIRLKNVSIAFGTHNLLEQAEFQLDAGERVGLLGRNGEGKSTLLKIIAGEIPPDSGEVWRKPELKLSWLEQAPHLPPESSVYDAVADGLGDLGELLKRYHTLSQSMGAQDAGQLQELGELQHRLEALHGWQTRQRVENVLSRLQLPADSRIGELSGGWLRRVALARVLVIEPEVLLLDEPTNHLDLESIAWLEEQLLNFQGGLLFITHDRTFLQNLATRIVDLDRGRLVSWPGGYADYLRRKAAALAEEEKQNALFDKKLGQEEVWIRQGIKARRTRNEGRVRALQKLRQERAQRRQRQGSTRLEMSRGETSGKKVISAQDISFAYQGKPIVSHFSMEIHRGDKIGLIGPNGAGKTTLLRLLLGELQPDSGRLELGTRLQVAYFDQLRAQLDPEATVADSVADGSDFIDIAGARRHVLSYLADFLFAPARARSPVKSLSGGERNRLLLARLFTQPANLIVMDEPTNDLDLETLEILEERLVNYDGTLLLVSHDRAFLDNVVTSILVFQGEGRIEEFVGGYSDWALRQKEQKTRQDEQNRENKPAPRVRQKKVKLSYKQCQELEQLPQQIEALEARQHSLNELINAPDFYRGDQQAIAEKLQELQALEEKLEQAYQRWDELEALQEAATE